MNHSQAFHDGHMHQQRGTHATGGCNASASAFMKCVRNQAPAHANSITNAGGRKTIPDRAGHVHIMQPAVHSKPTTQ